MCECLRVQMARGCGCVIWVGQMIYTKGGQRKMKKKSVKEYAIEVGYIIGGALMMAAWIVAMWAVSGQSYNIH